MSKRENQKLKLLYIAKLFTEKTDEEHTVTVNDIITYLEGVGIASERKSIYDDIESLKLFGLDIIKRKSKTHDYFLGTRDFELSEVKLLIDSVQSSRFITHKKSLELIKKLQTLASSEQSKTLQRQVHLLDRVKSMNESVLYNIDAIHTAISQNNKISFKYWNWAVSKERLYKKDGALITVNPTALTMDSDNYYLICYSEKYEDFTHYRVDKMNDVQIIDTKRENPKKPFNVAAYTNSVFSMFGGEVADVSILFDHSVVGVVIDRFGKDVFLREVDENSFIANVKVAVSPTFLAWVLGFDELAKVLSPDWVIDEVYDLGYYAIMQYREET